MDNLIGLSLKATLVTAGVLGLIYIVLAVRVIMGRFKFRVSLGDGGNPQMLARIRAHANFAEYVPFVLVLMGLIELSGGDRTTLSWCGAVLILSRVLQAVGVHIPKAPNPYRFVGTSLTFLLLIGFSIWGIMIGVG